MTRHPLGQLAYETYMEAMRSNGTCTLYFAWETLHPAVQDAYQKAAEAVWLAAFQSGADSVRVMPYGIP